MIAELIFAQLSLTAVTCGSVVAIVYLGRWARS
jgi:hypothetical protein